MDYIQTLEYLRTNDDTVALRDFLNTIINHVNNGPFLPLSYQRMVDTNARLDFAMFRADYPVYAAWRLSYPNYRYTIPNTPTPSVPQQPTYPTPSGTTTGSGSATTNPDDVPTNADIAKLKQELLSAIQSLANVNAGNNMVAVSDNIRLVANALPAILGTLNDIVGKIDTLSLNATGTSNSGALLDSKDRNSPMMRTMLNALRRFGRMYGFAIVPRDRRYNRLPEQTQEFLNKGDEQVVMQGKEEILSQLIEVKASTFTAHYNMEQGHYSSSISHLEDVLEHLEKLEALLLESFYEEAIPHVGDERLISCSSIVDFRETERMELALRDQEESTPIVEFQIGTSLRDQEQSTPELTCSMEDTKCEQRDIFSLPDEELTPDELDVKYAVEVQGGSMQIDFEKYLVEPQGLGDMLLGSSAMDLKEVLSGFSTMMPTIQSTVFDTRVIIDKVKDFLPMIESMISNGDSVAGTLNGFISACSDFHSSINTGKDLVKTKLIEMMQNISLKGLEPLLMLLVVGVAYFIGQKANTTVGVMCAIGAATIPLMKCEITQRFMSYVFKNFESIFKTSTEGEQKIELQGIGEVSGFSITPHTVVHLLLVAASLLIGGALPSDGKISKLIASLGKTGRDIGGISTGANTMGKLSAFVGDTICQWLYDADPNSKKHVATLSLALKFDVATYLADVHKYALDENRFSGFSTMQRAQKVRELHARSLELLRYVADTPVHAGLGLQINNAYKVTKQLLDDLHQFKGLGTARVDPFHISFFGESGIGKSTLVPQFCNDVLDFRGEPRIEGDDKYFRQPASKYWDGYYGQIMVIYDDLAAVVHNDTPSDVTEMIQIKSNTACQVVMADIKEKGLHFTSKYIVSTTNVPLMSADSGLRHPEAFHRRRNLLVSVKKVRAFNTGNPEFQNAGHLEFQLLCPHTLTPLSKPMDYGEFFKKVNDDMDAHFSFQDQILKSYDNGTYGKSVRERLRIPASVPVCGRAQEYDAMVVTSAVEVQALTKESEFFLDKAYFDGLGRLRFISPTIAKAFESLSDNEKSDFTIAIRNFYKSAVEKKDVEALLSLLPKGSPLRVAYSQCIDEITIVRKDDGVFELLWDDEDAQEEYETWEERDKYLFRCIVEMRQDEKRLLSEHSRSTKAVDVVLRNVQKAWDGLSENAKMALRLAVGAGSFLAIVGTLYSVKQRYAGHKVQEKNLIDNTVFSKPVDTVIVPEAKVDRAAIKDVLRSKLKAVYVDSEDLAKFDFDGEIQREDDSQFPNERSYANNRKNLVIAGRKVNRVGLRGGSKGNPIKNPYRPEEFVREDDSQFPRDSSYSRTRKNIVIAGKQYQHVGGRGGAKGNPIKSSYAVEGSELRQQIHATMTEAQKIYDAKMRRIELDNSDPVVVETQEATLLVKSEIEIQANHDNDAQNLIFNKFSRNLGIIFHQRGTSVTKMQCLFITDNCVIAPWHFFYRLQEGENFHILLGIRKVEIAFDVTKLVRIFERDLCVYRCGSRVEKVRPIVKFLATLDDHAKFVPTGGVLINSEFQSDINVMRMRVLDDLKQKTECMENVNYEIDGETHVLKGYSYRADTVQGECGSPIIQENRCTNGKIVGIHVCANINTKVAYAEMVVREQIESALQTLDSHTNGLISMFDDEPIVEREIFTREVESSILCDVPKGDLGVIGTVPDSLAIYVPQRSNINKTVLHGVVCQAKTEPAILSAVDPRLEGKKFDPIVSGINKYGGVTRPFNPKDRRKFVAHMIDMLKPLNGTRGERGVLSLEQTINGVPGVDFMDRMNMSSSEGFPYVKQRPSGFSNKSWMFKQVGEYYTGAPKQDIDYLPLKQKYLERIIAARKGERIFSVSAECTKDERVALKKIYEVPKTRVFTIMPCDFTMAVRSHFLDFCSMIMSNRAILPMKVGLNPIGAEWTELYEYLREYGDMGFAGDFQSFDGLIDGEVLTDIGEIINSWYGGSKEDNNVRQVLLSEHTHRYTLASNTLLEVYKGIPSGSAITVHVNNFVNLEYLSLAWLDIMRRKCPSKANMTCFFKFVRCAVFGDDNNIVPSPSVREHYNLVSVHHFLKEKGITYTDDKKRPIEESEPLVPVLDMTFLKRSYVPHPNWPMWKLAPLDKKSIEERVMWVRGVRDVDGILYSNIEESLFDAHMHGREYFEDLKLRINQGLHARGMRIVSFLYEDMECRWLMTIPVLKGIWEDYPTITARNAVVVQGDLEEITDTHGDIAFQLERDLTVSSMQRSIPSLEKIESVNWDLKSIAQRPNLLGLYTITSAMPIGPLPNLNVGQANEMRASYNLPQDALWNIDALGKATPRSAISRILAQHTYYRTDIVVRMHVNATPFYGGHVGLVWDPMFKHGADAKAPATTARSLFPLHHVMLDISTGNEIELRIPYNHVVSYLGMDKDFYGCSFMGQLKLVLFNRLMYPDGGSPSVDVSLYVYFENMELHTLREAQDPDILVKQGEQTQLKHTTAGEYSRASMDDAIFQFCLTNASLQPILNDSSQSMKIEDLVQREAIIEEGVWSENTPRHTDLVPTKTVTPTMGVTGTRDSGYQTISYPAMLSQMFCYWRGSLHFRVVVGATQFHTGRFVVVFHPREFFTTYNRGNFSEYPHLICDLKQGHEFNFSVPFVSATAWKPTFHERMFRNNAVIGTGSLGIFVLDTLRSPSGTTDQVNMFVTVRGGSDFQFAVPRNVSNTNNYKSHRQTDVRNGGVETVYYRDVLVQAENFPSSSNFVLGYENPMRSLNNFKEDFHHITNLMKRYGDCGQTFKTNHSSSSNIEANFDMGWIPVTPRLWMDNHKATCNPLAFFSQFYTFWRGSIKFKIHATSSVLNEPQFVRVSHVPNRPLPENPETLDPYWKNQGFVSDSGLAGQSINLSQESVMEFVVPYYSIYDCLFVRTSNMNRASGYPLLSSHNGCLKLQWKTATNLELKIYMAAGDDFEYLVPNGVEPIFNEYYSFGPTSTPNGRISATVFDTAAWDNVVTVNKPRFIPEINGVFNTTEDGVSP
uniref:Genome polyprotein n=1 Tax=Magellanic bog-moss seco-like virus TaxID=3115815 RepID=A0AAT9JHT1_9SECO